MDKIIQSETELSHIANDIAQVLIPGDIVLFEGELGVGKTTFVSSLASSLGITEPISSPTFTIVNHYSGDKNMCHIDLYRLTSEEDLWNLDINHYLDQQSSIVCIEWAEKLGEFKPPSFLRLQLAFWQDQHIQEPTDMLTTKRLLSLEAQGTRLQQLCNEVLQK